MKTAMQTVIDEITKLKEIDLELFKILTPILSRGEDNEKQQIIYAYNSSSWETDKDIEGHHYYDEKFKNNNPLM